MVSCGVDEDRCWSTGPGRRCARSSTPGVPRMGVSHFRDNQHREWRSDLVDALLISYSYISISITIDMSSMDASSSSGSAVKVSGPARKRRKLPVRTRIPTWRTVLAERIKARRKAHELYKSIRAAIRGRSPTNTEFKRLSKVRRSDVSHSLSRAQR